MRIMKRLLSLSVLCFLLLVPGQAICGQNESDLTGSVSLFFGQKFLDEDYWEPLDKQLEVGVLLFNIGQRSWPVNIAFDILYSWDDDRELEVENEGYYTLDYDGNTVELNIGARKFWDIYRIQPFIGGGLAIIRAEGELEGTVNVYGYDGAIAKIKVSDDDTGVGVWAECGARLLITNRFSLGLDLRYSWAEVTLFEEAGKAGGIHTGVLLGYHW